MGVLIDSSVLIAAERGRVDVTSKIRGREQEEFFISVVTASELLHGVWRAREAQVKAKRLAFVEGILQRFPILPIDLAIARLHAQLWAELESQGVALGAHDSWLAATCIARGYTLATGDIGDFKRVPGLAVETW